MNDFEVFKGEVIKEFAEKEEQLKILTKEIAERQAEIEELIGEDKYQLDPKTGDLYKVGYEYDEETKTVGDMKFKDATVHKKTKAYIQYETEYGYMICNTLPNKTYKLDILEDGTKVFKSFHQYRHGTRTYEIAGETGMRVYDLLPDGNYKRNILEDGIKVFDWFHEDESGTRKYQVNEKWRVYDKQADGTYKRGTLPDDPTVNEFEHFEELYSGTRVYKVNGRYLVYDKQEDGTYQRHTLPDDSTVDTFAGFSETDDGTTLTYNIDGSEFNFKIYDKRPDGTFERRQKGGKIYEVMKDGKVEWNGKCWKQNY